MQVPIQKKCHRTNCQHFDGETFLVGWRLGLCCVWFWRVIIFDWNLVLSYLKCLLVAQMYFFSSSIHNIIMVTFISNIFVFHSINVSYVCTHLFFLKFLFYLFANNKKRKLKSCQAGENRHFLTHEFQMNHKFSKLLFEFMFLVISFPSMKWLIHNNHMDIHNKLNFKLKKFTCNVLNVFVMEWNALIAKRH